MAEFLSAQWLQELDNAARSSTVLAVLGLESALVVEQHIADAPNGDVWFHLIIDERGARVVNGQAVAPDVTIVTDFATAVALHRGKINAQEALSTGIFKIGGDVDQLVRRRDAFEALDDMFAAMRATTTGTD